MSLLFSLWFFFLTGRKNMKLGEKEGDEELRGDSKGKI